MSGERILLDSVILIDHFNGVDAATDYLRDVLPIARISAITRAEVLTGFANDEEELARALLDRLPSLVIDAPVADLAADLRRQNRWKLPDAMQAALAKRHGLLFATRNHKDFPPKRHDFVRIPYRL